MQRRYFTREQGTPLDPLLCLEDFQRHSTQPKDTFSRIQRSPCSAAVTCNVRTTCVAHPVKLGDLEVSATDFQCTFRRNVKASYQYRSADVVGGKVRQELVLLPRHQTSSSSLLQRIFAALTFYFAGSNPFVIPQNDPPTHSPGSCRGGAASSKTPAASPPFPARIPPPTFPADPVPPQRTLQLPASTEMTRQGMTWQGTCRPSNGWRPRRASATGRLSWRG